MTSPPRYMCNNGHVVNAQWKSITGNCPWCKRNEEKKFRKLRRAQLENARKLFKQRINK